MGYCPRNGIDSSELMVAVVPWLSGVQLTGHITGGYMKQGFESVEKLVERANVLASLKRDYEADVRNTFMHYDGEDAFSLTI